MSTSRLALAWIACCAVLFNLLAMPISSAAPGIESEQLLWGSFCSSSGTRLVAISLGKSDHSAPINDDHSAMQHCWCCSGSAPLVSLPVHVPPRYAMPTEALLALESSAPPTHSPRHQWPSLNPRASPTA